MLMPASDEFTALCQAQVVLLTQTLGAALSVVYMAEDLAEEANPNLVPIVAYPEALADWQAERLLAFLSRGMGGAQPNAKLLPAELGGSRPASTIAWTPSESFDRSTDRSATEDTSHQRSKNHRSTRYSDAAQQQRFPQQVVLPLIHENVVMGLLVTARSDRPWEEEEQAQIEQIAQTLAIACLLDQRAQWLDHDLQQQRLLQARQRDLLDDLIHQLRNPLTAVRTFGKLLLKRLLPTDQNRSVADSILRESDRLQDLLKEVDRAVDLTDTDGLPESAPPQILPGQVQVADSATELNQANSRTKPLALPAGQHKLIGSDLNLEPHSVYDVLDPLLDTALAIAQDRRLDMEIELPDQLPPVRIDLKALREVLSNLMDNALKYTPPGGQIFVQAGLQRTTPNLIWQGIAIADSGPGIPLADLSHLFERHYRGIQANTEIPGSGLGLAIARELVQQMNGEIQIFSPVSTGGAIDWQPSADQAGTLVIVWLQETE